jgi:hypothetical protein
MMTNNSIKIIALSGVARSGKDTFASILSKKLNSRGYKVKTLALASPLKTFCADFCMQNLCIDVWTNDTSQKEIIRPFLVWFGDAKRKMTGGRFWIDLASEHINEIRKSGEYDYVIITDVRYDHYKEDELHWVLNELNAPLVHITQALILGDGSRAYLLPPNEHEAKNDPRIQQKSTYKVVWDKVESIDLLNDPMLNFHVDLFIDWLFNRCQSQNPSDQALQNPLGPIQVN